jgi:GntR family transcriptional regulator/MocR family aminotransferase
MQAALTDFIADGHYQRHVRRSRLVYAERAATLAEGLRTRLAGVVELPPPTAGMHLVAWLGPGAPSEKAIAVQALKRDLDAAPLSMFRLRPGGPQGLVLGYGNVETPEIPDGVERLEAAISSAERGT